MRIGFISVNRERLPDAVIPLGLLYVIASTPPEHDRRFWDLCFDEHPLIRVRNEIARFAPEIVAIGLRNIQSADYSGCSDNLNYYRGVVEEIRACSDVPVVIGGAGFSVMPQEMMRLLRPDYGISGEGEVPFRKLVQVLASGGVDCGSIANLHYFSNGELVSTAPSTGFQDLNRLPIPDRTLVDARYYELSGIDSVQSRRGCPLRCDYCTYPLIEGRTIRRRDPARVVDELMGVRQTQSRATHVFLVDSVFNLPPVHAKEVCREMIRRGFELPWTCYANPLGFDRELADLMVEAGCAGVEVGSDSGVDAVLDRLKKGFHTEQIQVLHENCVAAGLPDCHSFILGTSGETIHDVEQTLDFCVRLDPFAAILGTWTDDQEAVDAELGQRRQAFRADMRKLLAAKASEFPRWVIPSLGINFSPRLFRVLRHAGLRGPLWQHLHLLPAKARGYASAPNSIGPGIDGKGE